MDILYINEVDSTHTYLKNYIKKNGFKNPIAIVTQNQTNGIGSRSNSWQGKNGNLFYSFVVDKSLLPLDLPLQSSSIYFSYILKDILNSLGSKIWLKWPNDFFIENKKIGGTITNLSSELIYCGIGLNLHQVNNQFGHLDIDININKVLNLYFRKLESKILWKHIFSKYTIEFEKSKRMETTINNQKKPLEQSVLNSDGSIFIDNEKVFSLR